MKGPTTRDAIIWAMIEGLMTPRAGEHFAGTGVIACALCQERSLSSSRTYPPIAHGPYCPVTLARRLSAGDYSPSDATTGEE